MGQADVTATLACFSHALTVPSTSPQNTFISVTLTLIAFSFRFMIILIAAKIEDLSRCHAAHACMYQLITMQASYHNTSTRIVV